ncbi:hypothetical protein [Methanohalophilus sp. WG1-DM]|uniref:hypothetical protein n=1 Tax=Methanohalophilus sp. WG1-DM TaxID=2491675 RepID=UPI000FFE6AAC|nr:hypothetical protein [Methanohalophilus sp. WG1-DM]RXG35017.1 hypothetical protein CI957_41 [Methanohalophilus sp. WG1-DM]
MEKKRNTYFIKILIFLYIVGLVLYLYYSLSGSFSLSIDTNTLLLQLIVHYLYGFFFFIGLVSILRKYENLHNYGLFLAPLIPVIFYFNNILQKNEIGLENFSVYLNVILNQYLPISIFLYILLFVFTKFYMDFLSENLIRYISGKRIRGSLFGEYSFIKVYD